MEWLNEVFAQLGRYIDVPYLLIFMLLSYLVKRYLGKQVRAIFPKWQTVYTVLLIATIVGIPYVIFVKDVSGLNVVFSYALGTSLHELIFKYIERLWQTEK